MYTDDERDDTGTILYAGDIFLFAEAEGIFLDE
jgi:hypothetical protein